MRQVVAVAVALTVGAGGSVLAEPVTLDIGGVPATGELVVAEGNALSDGVVMLVHGTMGHHTMEIMAGQQERLEERGLNSLAISLTLDVPNRSTMLECGEVHRHSYTDAPDEIAAWLEWLEEQGASDITLAGHSRGGSQVADFVTAHPQAEKVSRVVLVAPTTWSAEAEAAAYEKRWNTALAPEVDKAEAAVSAGRAEEPMTFPGFLYCEQASVTPSAFLSYHGANPRLDTPALIADIKQPVLLVAGEGDDVVPDLEERFDPNWPATVETAVVVDGGHMFRDFAADDLADLIEEFVAR